LVFASGPGQRRIIGDIDGLVKVVAARRGDGSAGPILGVPHPTLSESFGETVLALTERGLHLG